LAIDGQRVLRLNMPLWQGGDRPDYRIGARVLAAIVPEPTGPEETVAIPQATGASRPVEGGIVSRDALREILLRARAAIDRHAPEAIVTLGGDCLVDLAPIAYLSERYGDRLAVMWIDAHPDVQGTAQTASAHAHVLALLVGEGDPGLGAAVRRPVDPKRVLHIGLSDVSDFERDFIDGHGMSRLRPEDVEGSPARVLEWLRASGATKVAVHFDLDVLDPSLCDFLLFHDPSAAAGAWDDVPKGRMTFGQVASILAAVGTEADVAGLAITELMPWSMIGLSRALRSLPLLGSP
jgi:arginase